VGKRFLGWWTEGGGARAQTRGLRLILIQERTADQVDGQAAIVSGGTAEAWQIGGGFVLAGGIQRAQADDQIAQGGQILRAWPVRTVEASSPKVTSRT